MKYRTIVADPPWPIGDFPAWHQEERRSRRELKIGHNPTPYQTMSIAEITALPIADFSDTTADDVHLYLWTVDQFLVEAVAIAQGWGFHKSATIVWCKAPMGGGLGGAWPNNVEFVLFCRRPKTTSRADVFALTSWLAEKAAVAGISRFEIDRHMGTSDMAGWWLSRLEHRCSCPTNAQWHKLKAFIGVGDEMDDLVTRINSVKGTSETVRTSGRWFSWQRGKHSAKPEAFLDLVEQVSPGPYLELFARRNRLGWDTWGNEALNHVGMGAA